MKHQPKTLDEEDLFAHGFVLALMIESHLESRVPDFARIFDTLEEIANGRLLRTPSRAEVDRLVADSGPGGRARLDDFLLTLRGNREIAAAVLRSLLRGYPKGNGEV